MRELSNKLFLGDHIMNTIVHITQRQKWKQAKNLGIYHADSLDSEGFIHCSKPSQILKVANYIFANQQGLILLVINSDQVNPPIRYEGADGEVFPHIYGELNIDAVSQVIDFEPGEDGLFELPPEMINIQQLDNIGQYVEQTALLLDLPIKHEYRDGVVANFERIKAIAQLVNSFPLPEEIEPAPVFEP
jgi:uncharacterized protein (DUF952 family)